MIKYGIKTLSSPEPMIEVEELDDGSLGISWDENDPVESKLNEWTEQDFIDCIRDACLKALAKNGVEPPT
jgi:hypothetical protein